MSLSYMETLTMLRMKKRGRKPKHPAQDATGRSGSPQSFRLNPRLVAWLEAFIDAQEIKPSKTAVIERALTAYFESKGFPPPPPEN